jgi:hypothetical protein
MDILFPILCIIIAVVIRYFFDNNVKKIDLSQLYKTVKIIPRIHKEVRSKQKFYRKSNKKHPAAFSQFERETTSEIYENSNVGTESFVQNSEVSKDQKYFFDKKTLKEAVVFKEILDLPVALR